MNNNFRGLPLKKSHLEQIFPKLTTAQIGRIEERGHIRTVKLGEVLIEQGESNVPFFVVVSGEIEILRPSGTIETLITGTWGRRVYWRSKHVVWTAGAHSSTCNQIG